MQSSGVKLSYFEMLSTLLHIEFGISPRSATKELQVIQCAMGGHTDPKEFLDANMPEYEWLYIINKKFWVQWSAYVGLSSGQDG